MKAWIRKYLLLGALGLISGISPLLGEEGQLKAFERPSEPSVSTAAILADSEERK